MSRQERILQGLALLRRNQVLTQMLDEAAADYLGINTTDGRALDVIDQRGGRLTAGELAHELRLSTGAVTAILDRLEQAGYARRVPDPHDRRRVLVEQTPKVHKAGSEIYGGPEDAFAWADAFSDSELDVLLRFHEQGKAWLEERLANVEKMIEDSRDRKRKRMRGRGRA
jgi:DNA-binding MarR family transcriptional regulator